METRRQNRPPSRQPAGNMSQPLAHPQDSPNQRILVRGVNWLGDAVMTTERGDIQQ